MIVRYRCPNDGSWYTWKWVEAILLGPGYWENSWYILRWNELLQDYEEVVAPKSQVRFTC